MRLSGTFAVFFLTSPGFSKSAIPQTIGSGSVVGGRRLQPVPFRDVRACSGTQRTVEPCQDLPSCDECTPLDCYFQSWEDWYALGGCTGLCQRSRVIASANNECGKPCSGALTDTKACPEEKCFHQTSTNCSFSEWSEWSTCSSSQRTRSRNEVTKVQGNGSACKNETFRETEACVSSVEDVCKFSQWSEWTPCTRTCASGYRSKSRHSMNEGLCSGTLRMSETCNEIPCEKKQDCVLGAWSEWSACEHEQKLRSRKVHSPARWGGKPCADSLKELIGCPVPPVIEDCLFSEWSDWADCSRSCGGGQSNRSRLVTGPVNGGQQCERSSLSDTMPCNTNSCEPEDDTDCKLSDWTEWSPCPSACGMTTSSHRSRSIANLSRLHGKGCFGPLSELKACVADACVSVDCEWGAWLDWSGCSRTCDSGYKDRTRKIQREPLYGGKSCSAEAMREVDVCNSAPCKQCIDGQWGAWSDWQACSATCDVGFTSRDRQVLLFPNDCGKMVEGLENEYKICDTGNSCIPSIDCQLSAWSGWTECTASCFGSRTRSRSVAVYGTPKGRICFNEALLEVDVCNGAGEKACSVYDPVDCLFSDWAEWSVCSASCSGQTVRERHVVVPSSEEGRPCEGASMQTEPCNTDVCDGKCTGCASAPWSEWSDCSGCTGTKSRQRAIPKMHDSCGSPCLKQNASEVTACSVGCSVEEFCVWSSWLTVGDCGELCGVASVRRTRSLEKVSIRPADFLVNGTFLACSALQTEAVGCPYVPCVQPVDCALSVWSDWREQDARTCGRYRSVVQASAHQGRPCSGPLEETKLCGAGQWSPVDCVLSDWRPWSSCGKQDTQAIRSRLIDVPADGGSPCVGSVRETKMCSIIEPAQRNCTLMPWEDWSDCTATCAGGFRTRQRSFEPAANGGLDCVDKTQEISVCGQASCSDVRDCVLGAWTDWAACSSDNQKTRTRSMLAEARNGGEPCLGVVSELASCPISVDCVVSDWSAYSVCDVTCGGGQRTRTRHVTQAPRFGGKICPSSIQETDACNTISCTAALNCELSEWEEWSTCSVSCGRGQTLRQRHTLNLAQNNGEACEATTEETKACSRDCALRDCAWADWTSWSGCSCDCGGGTQERYRSILHHADIGGKACEPGTVDEVRACNTQRCNSAECVEGAWGPWTSWSGCSASCHGGVVTRHRLIDVQANACGSPAIGTAHQMASCNGAVPCTADIDCKFGDWSEWGLCSQTCFGGKERARQIAVHRRGNGTACVGALVVHTGCNPSVGEEVNVDCAQVLPRNCRVGAFSNWGTCSASCGGGQQTRSRQIEVEASNGGKPCDEVLEETSACNTQQCPTCQPRDCKWSEWSSWGACDKCDGQRQRFRNILSVQSCGGKRCDDVASVETGDCLRSCHEFSYCGWSEWAPWSMCSATCGQGTRGRSRELEVKVAPSNVSSLSQLDSASLSNSLLDFDRRFHALETRRLQENVVAYAVGAVSLVFVGVLRSTLRRGSARGTAPSPAE